MLKQWMRRRLVSALAYDENDDMDGALRCPFETVSGVVRSPVECFEAWQNHFETAEYRAAAKKEGKAVSAFFFHWAGLDDIKRPPGMVKFDSLEGIKSSYQFFMLKSGEVLMRGHACWCEACFVAAAGGAGRETALDSVYVVDGCKRRGDELYEWTNKSCRASEGGDVGKPDERARARGHALAVGLPVGCWVLVECFSDPEDVLWLGRTVAFTGFGGRCSKKCVKNGKAYGTMFSAGDTMVAVLWYERVPGGTQRRDFVRGKAAIDVFNSTELRLREFGMEERGLFYKTVGAAAGTGAQGKVRVVSERVLRLPRADEAEAVSWCR